MKHLIVILLTLISFFSLLPTNAFAQQATGPWYNQGPSQFHDSVFGTKAVPKPDNEIFGERYTFAQFNWIMNSIANMFSFPVATVDDFINIIQQIISSTDRSFKDYAKLGLPGILIGGSSEIYSHPIASGRQEINRTMANLNLIPPVHAQGSYITLSPLRPIWTASRNTAYLLMVILLVASGFLIMFRVKINPQTVVSLQLMVPKIILTLILVTFSYAIAGLVIDMVFVILYFILAAFSANQVFNGNLQIAIRFFTNGQYSTLVAYYLVPAMLFFMLGDIALLLGLIAPPLAIPGVLIALITIIFMIAISILLFKLWWMLLKTYITLMLLIAIGPWQIMLGLLPGQSGFGSWFRNLIANASVFIVVPVMIIFNMLLWQTPFSLVNIPDLAGIRSVVYPLGQVNVALTGSLPVLPFMSGNGQFFSLAIGYVLLALTPKVAEMVRDALKVPPFKYGTALGQPMAPFTGLGGGYVSGVGDRLSRVTGPNTGLTHVTGSILQSLGGSIQRSTK